MPVRHIIPFWDMVLPMTRLFSDRKILPRPMWLLAGSLLAMTANAELHAVPAQPPPALAAQEARVAAIGLRLATANARACAAPQPLTGMVLHDIASYAPAERQRAAQAFGLSSGFGVRLVVPGSPADIAGIRAGDDIIALEQQDLSSFAADLIGSTGSAARSESFAAKLAAALASGPAALTLRRGQQQFTLSLRGVSGCGGKFSVTPDRNLAAWSDGDYVAITSSMITLASDDGELAFVLAHEMAHNMLRHAQLARRQSSLLANLGIGAGKIRASERAADALGVQIIMQAGFHPAAAETVLHKLDRARRIGGSFTHPGLADRIATIRSVQPPAASSDTEKPPSILRD